MFEDKYRQANDSLHPRQELLWEMEQKQHRRILPYARWSTIAACALVVLALGLFFGGRFFGGAKEMNMSGAAAADAAPREMADTADGGVEYKVESTMDTAFEMAGTEGVDETEEACPEDAPREVELANVEAGTGAEIAAVGETLLCRFRQDTCLLEVCTTEGEVLGELYLPEVENTACAFMELEESILHMYLEDGRELLIDLSDPVTPTVQ